MNHKNNKKKSVKITEKLSSLLKLAIYYKILIKINNFETKSIFYDFIEIKVSSMISMRNWSPNRARGGVAKRLGRREFKRRKRADGQPKIFFREWKNKREMDSNYDRRLRISEAKRVRLGLMKIVQNATRESQQLDAMRQGQDSHYL